MGKFAEKIRGLENFKALRDFLPTDHSNRQSLNTYIEQAHGELQGAPRVLDLGCGEGYSRHLFREAVPTARWHGVDIEDSPEVRKRTRDHETIKTFDGVNLPYSDAYFDLIYCNQVLEHVRYPDKLIAEAFRVLAPDGLFAGCVSYLEPFHSYSVFNFTPYGVITVFSDAGFRVKEIRASADASLLINRQLFNRSNLSRVIWNRNYLHTICDLVGTLVRLGHRERNFLKVQFAGHLFFLAQRQANTESSNRQA